MPELSRIASVSGQGGLFSVHTALKNGVVLESLDEKKTKLVAGSTSKVSILSEISIYTTTGDGSVSLESVLKALFKKHRGPSSVTSKSDGGDLRKFLLDVLPDADLDRVYTSDIKKLAQWYNILVNFDPEILKEEVVEPEKPIKEKKQTKVAATDVKEGEEPEKTAKKKKASKPSTA